MDGYLPSLKNCIKTGKTGAAKSLLKDLGQRHPTEKQSVLQILALAPDKIAYDLLYFLTRKDNLDAEIASRLVQIVIDRAHLNYSFVLILFDNASREIILTTIPLLRHILVNETDKTLLNSIIRISGKMKLESLTSDIAEFIFYDDVVLKQETIKALERIGTATAMENLEQAAKTEKCDQSILDAIEVLKARTADKVKTAATEKKRSGAAQVEQIEQLAAKDPDKRFDALLALSEDPDAVSTALSIYRDTPNPDLIINLMRLVSQTIPIKAVNDIFSIITRKKTDPAVRFAAYDALGAFPELESAAAVIQGVSDTAMFVRMAAVKALDKNLSDFVCAEIKNRIESGTKKGEILAQTILDAQARHLIEYLMISDTFSYMASNYLVKHAPEPVLDTFISILEKRNLKSTARKYRDIKAGKPAGNTRQAIVISPSAATRSVYSTLIASCGFSSLTFKKAQHAFETMMTAPPDLVICDLFLHQMTGLTFTREIRGLYPAGDLPVVISCLQKTLDSAVMKKHAEQAGATAFCEFPPKISQIRAWMG